MTSEDLGLERLQRAMSSAVGGVAIIIEEAAVNSALIFAAIGTLMAVLGAQGNAIVQMKSTVTSGAAFPGGAWPVGTA